jgi:hypothetical protein
MSLKHKVIPALAFIAVSSPATYKATAGLLGKWVADAEGLPKMGGLILHAIVFIVLVTVLMRLIGRSSGLVSCPTGQFACPDASKHPNTCQTSMGSCFK